MKREALPREVPLASLVEDLRIYPRHAVDGMHVSSLVDALKSGIELPPLVVERGSGRIVDGIHRYHARRRVLGDQATVAVIEREYASEADLLLDAIRLNAAHGRRLDRMDQARAVLLAEAAGASVEAISLVLHVPEKRVEQLRVRIAYQENAELPPIVLKRPAQHFAGRTMTEAQVAAHQSMPGTSLLLTARQLRIAVETDLINAEDDALRRELAALGKVLGPWLKLHSPLRREAA